MRVAYVFTFDLSKSSGLWPRLEERLRIWSELGVTADVFVCTGPTSSLKQQVLPRPHRLCLLESRTSARATFKLPAAVLRTPYDAVYVRYSLPFPGVLAVGCRTATVLEVHADDTIETRLLAPKYRLLSRSLRRALLATVDGFVFVDPELPKSVGFSRYKRTDGITVPNGIAIDSQLPYGSARSRRSGAPRLVLSIGANQPWQGIDRFMRLATLAPDLEFHLAGHLPASTTDIANVQFHGELDSSGMTQLLSDMDVGVGNLALDRIGRSAASPLKVREYIRAGLPVAIAHNDPDLAFEDPTLLKFDATLKATETSVNQLRSFAQQVAGSYCSRRLASAVDARAKEVDRVQFLESCADRHRS